MFEKMGASGLHKVFECMPDYNPIVGADAGTPQASYQVCDGAAEATAYSRPNALMSTHPLMPTTGRGDRGEQGLGERPRNPATGPSMRTFVLGSARSPASGQPSHNVCIKRQIKLDSAHEWPGSASINTPLPLARNHARPHAQPSSIRSAAGGGEWTQRGTGLLTAWPIARTQAKYGAHPEPRRGRMMLRRC